MAPPKAQSTIRQKILYTALVVAAASIPLPVNLNSIALILLVIACLIQQPLPALAAKLSAPSLWMLPAAYFLLLGCSYFWDVTGGFAVRDIERYAMLFFIPPALAAVPQLPQRVLRITGLVFIVVTIAVCTGCLIRSLFEYRVTADYRVFFYHYLSSQMGLNAIFLSNYCLAGIIWLLYYRFIVPRTQRDRRWNAPLVLAAVFLFVMILLLSSKLIISLTLLLLLFFVVYIGYIKRFIILALTVIVLLLAAGITIVSQLGYVKWRFMSTSAKTYSGPKDDNNGLSIRMLMWRTAWDLVRERPWLGYGVKGARVTVVERYRQENFMMGYEQGYHSHNQYLQSALMAGIPGLLLLLATCAGMAWRGLRKNNLLLLLLLFHFMCQSVIESTFEVQQELSFYVLFLFLFYYHPPESPGRQPAGRAT